MDNSDLQLKLAGCAAVESLTSEQRIVSTLRKLRWGTVHSSYYSDPKTEKMREVDVVGRQIWEYKPKSGMRLADLNLVVEAKSAKGFHLVFSFIKHYADSSRANYCWIGVGDSTKERILQTLVRAGLDAQQITTLNKKFDRIAFPRGTSMIYHLTIPPPPAEVHCS